MPLNDIIENARKKMHESVEHTRRELQAVRKGRASLSILEGVRVEY